MPNQDPVTVKVENLVTALSNMQIWCGVVRDALLQLDQSLEITVSEPVYDRIIQGPAQNVGGCKVEPVTS